LLSYFANEHDASPQGQADGRLPKGDISMEAATVQKEADHAYLHEFCFTIVPFGSVRKYVMYASNSVELSDWISALDKATKGKTPLVTDRNKKQEPEEVLSDSDEDSGSSGSDADHDSNTNNTDDLGNENSLISTLSTSLSSNSELRSGDEKKVEIKKKVLSHHLIHIIVY